MKPKKRNPILIIVIILFGIYLATYYAVASGYYEYKEYNKMMLTEEAMARFEQDVEAGKDITLEEYVTVTNKDYSNKISDLGLKTGESLENFFTNGLGNIFKVLSKLVTD